MTNLFQLGDFVLASGQRSDFKIECDALTPEDWRALAALATRMLPSFSHVEGVPRGGLPFAEALAAHAKPEGPQRLLIAEDVVTTGASMERHRAGRQASGVAAFSRSHTWPRWINVLFIGPPA